MATLYNQVTHQRVFIWLVTILGIAAAPALGYFTCTLGWRMDLVIAGLIIVATWAFVARDRWWVPFPAALSLGGTFYFGFKIPVHEMALLVCLFPLVLAVSTRWQGAIAGRDYPSTSVFLLAFYIFLHWIGSLIYNQMQGLGGAPNVTRSYMGAFWPMILFFTYYFFGNSKYIKTAFFLMYCALLFRVGMGILGYFFPSFLYIPGINYVLPTASGTMGAEDDFGGIDLRSSCPSLAIMSICYLCMKKKFATRLFHFFVIAICTIGVFLGAGRIGALVMMATLLYWSAITRRYVLLLLFGGGLLGGILFLNSDPTVLGKLPGSAQRTLSGFLVDKNKKKADVDTGSSDEWHSMLQKAGYERWTASFTSFLIGNGMRPYIDKAGGEPKSLEEMTQNAINTSRYESALWTTLCTLGLIGMILYLNVFRFLLADSLPLLWEKGICDYLTSLSFITSFGILIFIALGNFVGSFPSSEIMMGLFAKTLHDDIKREERLQQSASVENLQSNS